MQATHTHIVRNIPKRKHVARTLFAEESKRDELAFLGAELRVCLLQRDSEEALLMNDLLPIHADDDGVCMAWHCDGDILSQEECEDPLTKLLRQSGAFRCRLAFLQHHRAESAC